MLPSPLPLPLSLPLLSPSSSHNQEVPTLGLISAARLGHLEVCQLLISAVHTTGGPGNKTPLMSAVEGGHLRICQLFLRAGASVNARGGLSWAGETALILAAQRNDLPICRLLIEAGADSSVIDGNGMTALRWAQTHHGCGDVAAYLTSLGIRS
jgi:Ankyrin repeats (3 copies)/Ankyrin repeats (many copies)